LAEVEEPFKPGKIGSSTMPHKRNPMLCEAILALTRLVLRLAPAAWDAMIQENERDWTSDHIEWAYLPEISQYADGALALTVRVVSGLHVHPENMRRNLELSNGMILSEAVMLALAERIGRQSAHEAVYHCAMRAHEETRPFADVLAQDPVVVQHLSSAQISALLDPTAYTGLTEIFIDRLLRQAAARERAETV
jgi:adenylosuccinate lyase